MMSRNSEQNNSRVGRGFSPRRRSAWLLAASLSLVFSSLIPCPVFAQESAESNISKLEEKYFQHDFPKDETVDRLNRLEQLVFGETKTGSVDDRLKSLMALVPNLNAKVEEPKAPAEQTAPTAEASRPSRPAPAYKPSPKETAYDDEVPSKDQNSYPAVSAIEKKLLGRDYVGESLGKRLDRLEIKAFGKTNSSDDLQDRVDRLRGSSGVDVARQKPIGSEWADEEEDPHIAGSEGIQPFTGVGEDPSLNRSYRKQMSSDYGRPKPPAFDPYSGSGTFGAGGGSRGGSYGGGGTFGAGGTYGSGMASGGRGDGMPPSAPDFSRGGAGGGAPSPAPGVGVSQQISMLEKEVFQKTYSSETLLNRINRLETTVFPQDKPQADKSLPDRVSRLVAAVPLSQGSMPPTAPPKRQRKDPDFPDLDFNGPSQMSKGPSGLSKIINGLGSALGGGYTGSYNVAPGTLVNDPQTGLLYDQYTGTLIDPMTGAVVGRRSVQTNGFGNTGYGGFNSGFSPMSPFGGMGGGSGMQFGFGGGGMRFGGWP